MSEQRVVLNLTAVIGPAPRACDPGENEGYTIIWDRDFADVNYCMIAFGDQA